MECRLINNKLIIDHELSKDETYKISKTNNIQSIAIYKKPQWTSGLTSITEDMKHTLFIDYDNVCRWIVEKELEILAKKRKLIFYLFTTKEKKINGNIVGNYHAYCLSKFYVNEIVQIQRETSCDTAFTTMPLRNVFRSWVLRSVDKKGSGNPKFIKIIGNQTNGRQVSNAHKLYIEELFDVPVIDYIYLDKFKNVRLNHYETA